MSRSWTGALPPRLAALPQARAVSDVAGPPPGDPSWWFAEALQHETSTRAAPALVGRIEVDVAIVGGGFTGLWTAIVLKERAPRLRVALIEADVCGAGASGKNGGKVHGYWSSLPTLGPAIGEDAAIALARPGRIAQDRLRGYCTGAGRDVWWREGGNLLVSTTPQQDAKLRLHAATLRRMGVGDAAAELSAAAVAEHCRSPRFRGGIFYHEGATVHPGRLVRSLRSDAIAAGVNVFERTPKIRLDRGGPNRIVTPNGEILARDVVLATNVDALLDAGMTRHVSIFSSYAVMSAPAPDRLAQMNWRGEEGMANLRMFLHYFRKTPDGRVLMGSGSGPIAFGRDTSAARLRNDGESAHRAVRGLRSLLPSLDAVPVERSWGGAIDVASDRLPMIGTVPNSRVHFACGFSGHGVNPAYIAGQCLASLVAGARDMWTTLPLVTRRAPTLPPEPVRFLGGNAVRWGILSCEEAEDRGTAPSGLARAVSHLPRLLGMRIGLR